MRIAVSMVFAASIIATAVIPAFAYMNQPGPVGGAAVHPVEGCPRKTMASPVQ
jgi:hypothetical protein